MPLCRLWRTHLRARPSLENSRGSAGGHWSPPHAARRSKLDGSHGRARPRDERVEGEGGLCQRRDVRAVRRALDPAAFELDEGRRFSFCQPGPLADLFRGVGLNGVEVRAIDIPTTFKDFDDFWTPFLGGQGSAPGYAMSLDKERREQLRDRIRVALPFQADGTIHLMARAWAVRARR